MRFPGPPNDYTVVLLFGDAVERTKLTSKIITCNPNLIVQAMAFTGGKVFIFALAVLL